MDLNTVSYEEVAKVIKVEIQEANPPFKRVEKANNEKMAKEIAANPAIEHVAVDIKETFEED